MDGNDDSRTAGGESIGDVSVVDPVKSFGTGLAGMEGTFAAARAEGSEAFTAEDVATRRRAMAKERSIPDGGCQIFRLQFFD